MVSKKGLARKGQKTNSGQSKKKRRRAQRSQKKAASPATGFDPVVLAGGEKLESNAHVRCQKVNVPLKSIDEIMDPEILRRKTPSGSDFYLPFQNCCYHSKVH